MALLMPRTLGFLLLVGCGVACAQAAEERRGGDDDDDNGGGNGGTAGFNPNGGGGSGGNALPSCGNGTIDAEFGETCDGDDFGGVSCVSLGLEAGEVVCDPQTCVIDASGCGNAGCGNDMIDPGEECDGTDLGDNDCASLGLGSGTLACDLDCMFTGCSAGTGNDFEDGALGAGWTSIGTPWSVSTVSPHSGTYCATSADIADLGSTSLVTTAVFSAAGTVSFWHRESSESGYDYLSFYVDGIMQVQWSGENAWALQTSSIAAGTHQLEWRYSKDGSLDGGSDAVYVDDILIN
jgi:hypothetical protein